MSRVGTLPAGGFGTAESAQCEAASALDRHMENALMNEQLERNKAVVTAFYDLVVNITRHRRVGGSPPVISDRG